MGHRIVIMHSKEELAQGGAPVVAHAPGHAAVVEETVTQMISTLPRMFRMLKHQARSADSDGPVRELGDSQVWVLYSLATGSKLTSELAHRFNVTNPTMTRIVDGLVERGYVERRPSLEDRRQIDLQLTHEGQEAARYANEQFRKLTAHFVSPLSDEQLNDVALACRHLASLLPEGDYDYHAICPPRQGEQEQAQLNKEGALIK